jgi:hypothetical protein
VTFGAPTIFHGQYTYCDGVFGAFRASSFSVADVASSGLMELWHWSTIMHHLEHGLLDNSPVEEAMMRED